MKRYFGILASVAMSVGCTHGMGEHVVGAVVLTSMVAQTSQEGDPSAHKLWCSALRETDRYLFDTSDGVITPEEQVALEEKVRVDARAHGYALHAIQVTNLIKDAENILRSEDARTAEQTRCSELESEQKK